MADQIPEKITSEAAEAAPTAAADVPAEVITIKDTLSPPLTPETTTPEFISVTETATPLLPDPDAPLQSSSSTEEEKKKVVIVEPEKDPAEPKLEEPKKITQSLVSFKEESSFLSDLSHSERKSFEEFKNLVRESISKHEFAFQPKPAPNTPPQTETDPAEEPKQQSEITPLPEEVSIWGVPLLKDERTDVILLKFLRARDFKVKEAFLMLRSTMRWRKEFGIDNLVDEDLGDDLEKVVFMHGFDKSGHPVCYNVYGEFQNKELYNKTFADEEKRVRFLRWRIQFLERSIRKLDFSPGGVSTIFQVSDLKNSPGPAKRELRLATRQALQLLQDNYPEFVTKQVFVNVPWWYLAFYTMISPFLTQRTKSKFVFASQAKTAETLFKYITPEQVPIQYGGLSVDFCECNPDFTMEDPASEITIKPQTKQTVEILANEKCFIIWELRVVGWEVSYSAEYVPSTEGGYIVVIHKAKKMAPTDEPVVSSSFKISELGKIVLTIDNPTSKKKKVLYRFHAKPLCD